MCRQCLTTLNEHIKYKEKLITNQKKLYSHVGSHSFVNVNIKEEPIEDKENFSDFNVAKISAVKMENDEDNRFEDSENEIDSIVETQPLEEESKKIKRKNRKNSVKKEPCQYCSKMLLRRHVKVHTVSPL